jgi:hypothetical protein
MYGVIDVDQEQDESKIVIPYYMKLVSLKATATLNWTSL